MFLNGDLGLQNWYQLSFLISNWMKVFALNLAISQFFTIKCVVSSQISKNLNLFQLYFHTYCYKDLSTLISNNFIFLNGHFEDN